MIYVDINHIDIYYNTITFVYVTDLTFYAIV